MSSVCSGAPPAASEAPTLPTSPARKPTRSHHTYAIEILDQLTVHGCRPVFHAGELFVLDETTSIWQAYDRDDLYRRVADTHDGKQFCSRRADYVGVTEQVLSIASDPRFFADAPVGIACSSSFYCVDGAAVRVEPLTPEHRQRVLLDFEPAPHPTPLFDDFLSETFRSDTDGEEAEQRRLVQEIAGAALLGVMPRFQKAVLFYDPYGRAGKGTLERIVRQLVPKDFTSAVSPFKWDKEYYLASLVGKRLNVVGELPEGESVPTASFKSVLGGDLLAGREPARPVVNFHNEAAHLFTSNHLISTRDHSEAFFARWLLVEFPNSLLVSGRPLDTELADRIISQELPGIADWALQGGARLLGQGKFSSSQAHDRLMARWRVSSNSIDEFIHECCELNEPLHERRSYFYRAYTTWCQENGRKPVSKSRAKELMEFRIGLPVRFSVLDGHEVIRGIGVREAYKDRLTSI